MEREEKSPTIINTRKTIVESCVSPVYGKQQIHRVVFCCEVFRVRRGFNSHIMPSPTFPRF